ncbi:MAG: hypothetical protein WD208_12415, partial [Dehalococcoidia bacterium]
GLDARGELLRFAQDDTAVVAGWRLRWIAGRAATQGRPYHVVVVEGVTRWPPGVGRTGFPRPRERLFGGWAVVVAVDGQRRPHTYS